MIRRSSRRAALAAPGNGEAGRTDPRGGPELAVVFDLSPDDPVIRSMVSELLENGIYFNVGHDQTPARTLPHELKPFKAVLFDDPAYRRILADAAEFNRLEEYVKQGGLVFKIETPLLGDCAGPGVNPNLFIDLIAHNRVHDIMIHAGVERWHRGMARHQLARPPSRMIAELKGEMLRGIKRQGWGEYALHNWKAAKALIDSGGHDDVRAALIESVRASSRNMVPPIHHDKVGGFFAAAWVADETGDREPLEAARRVLDEVMARRPRHMGQLIGCGFRDDPLGVRIGSRFGGNSGDFAHLSQTVNRRNTVWNEGLHLYGPAFAAIGRATGEKKYLDEALGLAHHVERYHLRDDGLLAHCSREGQRVSPAWARGQTHALYGLLYVMEELPRDDPEFKRLLALVRKVANGLMPHQDPATGLWRNVIDNPQARPESSGTTGIVYVVGRSVREGWLDRDTFEPMLHKGWEGLRRVYWRGGIAANCRGSGPGADESYYLARPQGWAKMPHLLLAALEMQRMFPES